MRPLVAALALLFVAAWSADAAACTLLQPIAGTTYEMRDDAARVSIAIPVDPSPGLLIRDVTAAVVSVSLAGRQDLVDRFSAATVPAAPGQAPLLRLDVRTDPGIPPGDYLVVVDLRQGGLGAGAQACHQRLELTIAHPAATLHAPATILVEKTEGIFGWGDRTQSRQLHLDETSDKTQLTGIHVAQIDGPTGSTVTDGELRFEHIPTVPPGGHAVLEPTLHGAFPLGASTGTLEIDAPQLMGPASASFEVRQKLFWVYLVLAIAAGVALGYLSRVVLAKVIARGEARQRAYAEIDAIELERGRRPDAEFRNALAALVDELQTALNTQRDPANLNSKVDDVHGRLEDEVRQLEQRREQALEQLTQLLEIARTPWVAPKPILDAVLAQTAKLNQANTLLASYDVAAATKLIEDARSSMRQAVVDHVRPWETDVRKLVASLPELNLPYPVSAEAQAARTAIEGALDAGGADQPEPDLRKVMEAVHAAQSWLLRLAGESLARIPVVATTVVDELAGIASDASLTELKAAAEKLAVALKDFLAGQLSTDTLRDRIDSVLVAMRSSILDAAPDDATREAAASAIDAGHYTEAARQVAAEVRTQRVQKVLGSLSTAGTSAVEEVLPELVSAATVAPSRTSIFRVSVPVQGAALAASRRSSLAALTTASLVRTLITLIGVVAVGVAIFLPTFNGTFDQFAAAFFWGFAADFTAEGLYTLAKSAGTAPASTAPAGSAASR